MNAEKCGSRRRWPLLVAAALLSCGLVYLFFGGAVRQALQRRRLARLNVILITLDTTRADHLGCYNPGLVETPALDELAAGGTRFETCITQTPLTLPAHTTIFSGTYPLYHQVRDNGGFVVPEKLRFIGEILRENGFATAGFVASYVMHSKWGCNQGFDLYQDRFDLSKYKRIGLGEVQKSAAEVLAEARAWLDENGERRFFTWIHLYDPHTPYEPPPEFRERYAGHPYRGEVAYMDAELGKFFAYLKEAGIWERSLIIAAGDHGEMLGEHREPAHGFFLYEASLRVPLIVHAPFAFPVKRARGLCELVDIAPTIVDCLKLKVSDRFQGESLLPRLFDAGRRGKQAAYSETYYPRLHFGWSELRAFYDPGLKLIAAPRDELYDWRGDPAEAENLLLKRSYERAKLKERLSAFSRKHSLGALLPVDFKETDHEALQRLQTLGYITSTVDVAAGKVLADPKEKIGVFLSLSGVRELLARESYREAIERAREIIAADPEIIDAHMLLGNIFLKVKDYASALAQFREVLRRKPDYNFAMLNVVQSLIGLGDQRKVLAELENFLKVFPDDAILHYEKGESHLRLGQKDAASAAFRRAAALDPQHEKSLARLGELHFQKQEIASAESYFKRALAAKADSPLALFSLALIEEKRGNPGEAEARYRSLLESAPRHLQAAYNLAELLRNSGRGEEALAMYARAIEINPAFNIPYFMIAKHHFDRRQNLEEAIRLCEEGVKIKPADKYTAFGFYVLADIYSYLGRPERSQACLRQADELMRSTGRGGGR